LAFKGAKAPILFYNQSYWFVVITIVVGETTGIAHGYFMVLGGPKIV